tara:strand:- start:665 stop:916 length:252 start_codon:yes stop_codon:yes gene_type:complete
MIKVLVLVDNQILISKIEEMGVDIGEPDCKLTKPFILNSDGMLEPWLMKVTRQDVLMMSSDKILTLVDPTPTLLEKYEDLIKE